MLAMADKYGRVWGSIPGLASRTRISVEGCRKAIAAFLSPDEDSRTKDLDGRRIIEIDGGWQLVNHDKYRAIRDSDERREQVTGEMQEDAEQGAGVTKSVPGADVGDGGGAERGGWE